ncbi:HlyD family secretion protein [Psychroserpens luteolus]|uniref:HlyD family secretion protein n=1 Tax=Psychroserpens luteolus TaxID=2855840 RepID=UPI001E5EC161|nr:HlyD family efflux transporter periplasmic adaptor subunit [Psychroserpens luteolus]MCD2260449.1 HlyD family secretion protein [Psychroserpens luteolus]
MKENEKHIELRSEHIQELLEGVPNWMIRYGNLLILAFIIMFLMLSWFIKYPDIIVSEAHITTKLPPQKKYAQITGKIDSILITDNETLKENNTIAVIENTANFEHIQLLKSVIDTIKPNNKNFKYPIDELPILFLGDIDSEYALFENNYILYQLNQKLKPFANEQNGNQFSKGQLYTRLRTLQSQKRTNETELVYQKKYLERQQRLFENGVISRQTLESEELKYLQAERNFANMDASISQIKEAIANANTNEVSTSIKKTKEEISLLKNVIQSFNQLKRALIDWEMTYTITSDINGKVAFSELWTKHQTVNQGELLFTIIPEQNSSYIAKLKTPAQNSGKIKIGQTVQIKLENYPEAEYGDIKGQIESISLLADEDGYYLITVSLPSKLITSYDKEIPFRYEMRGSAKIITEDLRLIERFFYQLKNVFNN